MKIATTTGLVVLVCLLGGFLAAGAVGWQYQSVEAARDSAQRSDRIDRDLRQLRANLNQWFVTIDLFFFEGQSYVAQGVIKQTRELSSLLETLQPVVSSDLAPTMIQLAQISDDIERLAKVGPTNDKLWNQGLMQVDDAAVDVVTVAESLSETSATARERTANELAELENRLQWFVRIGGGAYVLVVLLVWLWANKAIVAPIERLNLQARDSADPTKHNDGNVRTFTEPFHLRRAPREVAGLADRLNQFSETIFSRTQTIEQQRAELQEQLDELERTRDKLIQAEKMASVGQLAAGVAHEINNPMSFVTGNLNTLRDYVGALTVFAQRNHELLSAQNDPAGSAQTELGETGAEPDTGANSVSAADLIELWEESDLEFIVEDVGGLLADSATGAERVRKIVAELSEFTNVANSIESCNINEIVQREISEREHALGPTADTPSIVIDLQLGDQTDCECAPLRVAQAVGVLLDNALDASKDGRPITVRTGRSAKDIWLEVEDRGPGIEADNVHRIFDPFFTTKPVGTGIGLGLHFVQATADQHGGEISVATEPDAGATFRLSLPALAA